MPFLNLGVVPCARSLSVAFGTTHFLQWSALRVSEAGGLSRHRAAATARYARYAPCSACTEIKSACLQKVLGKPASLRNRSAFSAILILPVPLKET